MRLHPILQILLAPLSLLYGIGVLLNDLLYRLEIVRPTRFGVPTICVGNLTVGGSGKSPHVEYIVNFLRPYISVGTLSRGYKRKTRGFQLANEASTPEDVGDEPLQYRRKFNNVMVAVGENRTFAIMYMVQHQPDLQCVVLDDAFQHRAVQAGLSLLLTEYSLPFTRDYLLPSGRLREWRTGYQRANIMIVTKCPMQLSDNERLTLTEELNPYPTQRVYFSYYKYGAPYRFMFPSSVTQLTTGIDVLLICAIANASYLVDYLKTKVNTIKILEFADHHFFVREDIGLLKRSYNEMTGRNKIVITTEKDAIRLEQHYSLLTEYQLPMFVLPVQVAFHGEGEEERFQDDIADYLLAVRR